MTARCGISVCWWITSLVVLCGVLAQPTLASCIWDDFEDGNFRWDGSPVCWTPSENVFGGLSGEFYVLDGNLVMYPDANNTAAYVWVRLDADCAGGTMFNNDKSVEARVRVINARYSYLGVHCLWDRGYFGGIAAGGEDSHIWIERYDGGVAAFTNRLYCPIEQNRFYRLRLEVIGSVLHLNVWPADEDTTPMPQDAFYVNLPDSTYRSGLALLGHVDAGGQSEFSYASVCSVQLPQEEPRFRRGDANDDGTVDLSDAVALLMHLFAASGDLPAPFVDCGVDLTSDVLGCMRYAPCE